MSDEPKSPAKRRQPPAGPQAKSTRTTRSQLARQQEVACSQPEPLGEEKKQCKGCGKAFKLFYSHLKRSDPCAAQYDMAVVEAEEKKRQKDKKRAHNKAYKEEHREELLEKQRTPERRAAMKAYYEENREEIREKQHTPEKRAALKKYYE